MGNYMDKPETRGTAMLLDTLIVGSHDDRGQEQNQTLAKDLEVFSQEQAGITEPSLLSQPLYSQKEVRCGAFPLTISDRYLPAR